MEKPPLLAVPYDVTSSSPLELLARLDGACRLLWIADLSAPELGARGRLLRRSGEVVDVAGVAEADVPAAVAASSSGSGIDGVVAFADSQLHVAASLAAALGRPGNPAHVVDRLNDKLVQRRALAEAGVPGPGFAVVQTAAPGAIPLDGPLVVKPLHGESSRDVVRVDTDGELGDALARLDAGGTATALVEQYLPDAAEPPAPGLAGYASVECIVADGEVVPVALTGKFPLAPPFRETGNFLPHPFDADLAAELLDLAVAAAHALGVVAGALHTEIKLTPSGPQVIEVNGRVGGGAIDALVERRTGRSMTARAVDVALGRPHGSVPEHPAAHAGPFDYELFLQPPMDAVTLRSIGRPDAAIGVAGAQEVAPNRAAGDALDWRAGSQGYVLRVRGLATDVAELGTAPTSVADAVAPAYDLA